MKTFRNKLWLAAGFAILIGVVPAHASIVITVGTVGAVAGSMNDFLDVNLTNTGPGAVNVAGFDFTISTTNAGINFTTANISTASPYIFAGASLFGPDIHDSMGISLEASDVLSGPGNISVASGTTFGLAHVLFNVTSMTATGPIVVALAAFPSTSLADAMGNNVPFTGVNGVIIVSQPTSVPEPATWSIFAGGLTLLAVGRRRFRR